MGDKHTNDQLAAMTEECRNLQEQVKKLMQDNTALKVQCQNKEDQVSISTPSPGVLQLHQLETVAPLASSPARVDDLPRDALNMSGVLNLSASSCSDISQLELSLEEAEEKIAGLLKVKEKLVQVQAEKCQLEVDVSQLEDELSTLAVSVGASLHVLSFLS